MGLTLGQKIRQLRLAQGLTQQQLAGSELTRAFISLVEQDKCQPSAQTLALLARRLGKPVEYFLDDGQDDQVQAVELLLAAASRSAARGEVDAALQSALGALRLSQRLGNPRLECRAQQQVAELYEQAQRYPEAYEHYEEALDLCKQAGDRRAVAELCLRLGRCAVAMEDFPAARRNLQRAVRLSEGKKSLSEVHCRALVGLGRCLYHMGDYGAAAAAYERALQAARAALLRPLALRAYWGLGQVLSDQGQDWAALEATRQALALAVELGDPAVHRLRLNAAAMLLRLGRAGEARTLLEEALAAAREKGDLVATASALEELATYWLGQGDPDRAEGCCHEALSCLDQQDDGLVRGHVYRTLGRVHLQRGNTARAHELLRISADFFRRLRAQGELAATLALIQEAGAPAPCAVS